MEKTGTIKKYKQIGSAIMYTVREKTLPLNEREIIDLRIAFALRQAVLAGPAGIWSQGEVPAPTPVEGGSCYCCLKLF